MAPDIMLFLTPLRSKKHQCRHVTLETSTQISLNSQCALVHDIGQDRSGRENIGTENL